MSQPPSLTVEEVSAKWTAHTALMGQIEVEIDALEKRRREETKTFTAECAPVKVGDLVEVIVNGKVTQCEVQSVSPTFSTMNIMLTVEDVPDLPAWALSLIVMGKNGRPNAKYTGPISRMLQPTRDGSYLALTGKPKKGAGRG